MPTDPGHIAQIEATLKQRYFPVIAQLQPNWTPAQHERNRLSRSLAAFAVEKLADIAPAQAANAIVDGGNDNGVDAVFFDRLKNRLWLIQSKAGGALTQGTTKSSATASAISPRATSPTSTRRLPACNPTLRTPWKRPTSSSSAVTCISARPLARMRSTTSTSYRWCSTSLSTASSGKTSMLPKSTTG